MKKLDKFVLRSFIGPFALIFLITLFLLDMQFLWKYVDDLVGKGLEWYVIVQLMFYASASFVPLAFPLAILLSSLMTMGDMGEFYELTALKSAGISLSRIMRAMLGFAIGLTMFAIFFANYILPIAQLKFDSLLYDIVHQRPVFNIKEGVFYSGIDGYAMRVNRKGWDGKTLYEVMIYDHTSGRGVDNVLLAERGEMSMTTDKKYLILDLYNGYRYEDLHNDKGDIDHEQTRMYFKQWHKVFDMSGFKMSRSKEDLWKQNSQMLNFIQLDKVIDTFYFQKRDKQKLMLSYAQPYCGYLRGNLDSIFRVNHIKALPVVSASKINVDEKKRVLAQMQANVRSLKGFTGAVSHDVELLDDNITRFQIEWWRKISLSFTCIVLFLVGAPLGAIIRKGGLGLPFVIAILMFIGLYVVSITGEKLAKDFILSPFWGMWLANIILMPVGLYISYKAGRDANLFNRERYAEWWARLTRFIQKRTEKI